MQSIGSPSPYRFAHDVPATHFSLLEVNGFLYAPLVFVDILLASYEPGDAEVQYESWPSGKVRVLQQDEWYVDSLIDTCTSRGAALYAATSSLREGRGVFTLDFLKKFQAENVATRALSSRLSSFVG